MSPATKSSFLLALAAFVLTSCAPNQPSGRRASQSVQFVSTSDARPGRVLFLKNCAHCHGADAQGDEGPDLHNLDWSGERIAARIRNGKEGEMTAFASKLSEQQILEVTTYVRTLK